MQKRVELFLKDLEPPLEKSEKKKKKKLIIIHKHNKNHLKTGDNLLDKILGGIAAILNSQVPYVIQSRNWKPSLLEELPYFLL